MRKETRPQEYKKGDRWGAQIDPKTGLRLTYLYAEDLISWKEENDG